MATATTNSVSANERTWVVNGRLAGGRRVDLALRAGRIEAILPAGEHREGRVHDLGGWLLLPAMAEPHAHLDKALTAEQVPNPKGDLLGAIEGWVAAAEAGVFTHDDMMRRIREALDKLLLSGVTAVRSHINCGSGSGISHLLAAQEAAAGYVGLMDIEFVALTHTPMVGPGSETNRRALDDAVEIGVQLIGGCPHLETDGDASIAHALSVAAGAGLPVDLHVDETLDPTMLTLRSLARQVIERGMEGRVAASHCVSLGVQPVDVQEAVAAEVASAGIAIVPLPQTNLFLQGRDHPVSTPRGLTAIAALRAAGVLIAAGADNVQDPFNLVGRSDPLETAALLVMAGHVLPDDAYDMVSNNVRLAMRLDPVRFEPGDPADFVAIDAPSIRGAVADAPSDRRVFHAGRLVAETSTSRSIRR
ncbi:MAG TPA: amidohydrolase family protein [Ilumatobacter sp.]|nr:amidohydrolase family protein [Ilumatobacter sp.]